jgi:hypothetical protein
MVRSSVCGACSGRWAAMAAARPAAEVAGGAAARAGQRGSRVQQPARCAAAEEGCPLGPAVQQMLQAEGGGLVVYSSGCGAA